MGGGAFTASARTMRRHTPHGRGRLSAILARISSTARPAHGLTSGGGEPSTLRRMYLPRAHVRASPNASTIREAMVTVCFR